MMLELPHKFVVGKIHGNSCRHRVVGHRGRVIVLLLCGDIPAVRKLESRFPHGPLPPSQGTGDGPLLHPAATLPHRNVGNVALGGQNDRQIFPHASLRLHLQCVKVVLEEEGESTEGDELPHRTEAEGVELGGGGGRGGRGFWLFGGRVGVLRLGGGGLGRPFPIICIGAVCCRRRLRLSVAVFFLAYIPRSLHRRRRGSLLPPLLR
mmetsp:Transcript_36239/g.108641  ORF Transcript_36239/g.108641 Transcript_36239/m.108641 type:complete len:207 (+) Transcript_36239:626-1246(+)